MTKKWTWLIIGTNIIYIFIFGLMSSKLSQEFYNSPRISLQRIFANGDTIEAIIFLALLINFTFFVFSTVYLIYRLAFNQNIPASMSIFTYAMFITIIIVGSIYTYLGYGGRYDIYSLGDMPLVVSNNKSYAYIAEHLLIHHMETAKTNAVRLTDRIVDYRIKSIKVLNLETPEEFEVRAEIMIKPLFQSETWLIYDGDKFIDGWVEKQRYVVISKEHTNKDYLYSIKSFGTGE